MLFFKINYKINYLNYYKLIKKLHYHLFLKKAWSLKGKILITYYDRIKY